MAVMNRASFPRDLEDGLNAHFGMAYMDHPQEWKDVFEVESSDRAWEEDVLEYGFGAASEKEEGGAVAYDQGGQAWSARYNHVTVALAFALTEEAIEDNRYQRLGPKFSKALARAMVHTKEIYGAAILNNSTSGSHLGGDGKALLATDHPLAGGGTFSNKLAVGAQLSEPAIEDLLIQVRKAKDDRGLPIALKPVKFVVPPELEFTLERLTATMQRPGTADNDINAARSRRSTLFTAEPCILTRLTDADAWYILTDAPDGLKHFKRIAMQRGMEGDFDTGNARYKARERYSFGWTDPRGIYGSVPA